LRKSKKYSALNLRQFMCCAGRIISIGRRHLLPSGLVTTNVKRQRHSALNGCPSRIARHNNSAVAWSINPSSINALIVAARYGCFSSAST
jgi:hypothetical protein